ncbi:hypothetical protein VCHA37P200_100153 [Vibrio chagasii]|nr:hypothetical protein VCHA41O249_120149 [Vibrio chagasii]CAH6930270.1 hypothetical protein VCHA53O468_110154 [Vibrio chagasii]CAH6931633.1 hypothetical protein VCHA43P282_110151 [Vibrio chagasii]CAH6952581.1 hypothetical protein VCHA55O507_100156 [Vibrio chagasii]CAH6956945.1 hypothetical protein VCHA53O474_110149 [Vibrio chagasii]
MSKFIIYSLAKQKPPCAAFVDLEFSDIYT